MVVPFLVGTEDEVRDIPDISVIDPYGMSLGFNDALA
jgi:hypothetical protein